MRNFMKTAKEVNFDAMCKPISNIPFRPLEEGCTIAMPKDIKIYRKEGEINNFSGRVSGVPFVIVEINYFGCHGWETRPLFLNILTKWKRLSDGNIAAASGEVPDFIRQYDNWGAALTHLAGRKIRISSDYCVPIPHPKNPELKIANHFYRFDFAD